MGFTGVHWWQQLLLPQPSGESVGVITRRGQ